jgi:hypothetical protein
MTITAVSKPPRVTWRAGRDRVDHAHAARATRTLCQLLIVPENLAWPPLRRCTVCRVAVEGDR